MGKDLKADAGRAFIDNMSGGAFICRAHGDHELLFVNDNLVSLFECEDSEDFTDFVGGAFDGIANETKLSVIKKEIQLQVREAHSTSGYIFFNIRTKKNNKKRVVAHWSFVKHPMEGDVIYGIIYLHRPENTGADFDTVTGL